jgi:predicted DNA-binding protein YlxM (UPF0122 family)
VSEQIEKIKKAVAGYFQVPVEQISHKGMKEKAFMRHIAVYLCVELTDKNQTDIAPYFHIERSSISHYLSEIKDNLHRYEGHINHLRAVITGEIFQQESMFDVLFKHYAQQKLLVKRLKGTVEELQAEITNLERQLYLTK